MGVGPENQNRSVLILKCWLNKREKFVVYLILKINKNIKNIDLLFMEREEIEENCNSDTSG